MKIFGNLIIPPETENHDLILLDPKMQKIRPKIRNLKDLINVVEHEQTVKRGRNKKCDKANDLTAVCTQNEDFS